MRTFDAAGPLPAKTLLLEASAGTGKTHAIAALAVRYLAETEVSAGELTVITFSRSATQELRDRLLSRVRQTEQLLVGVASGAPLPDAADAVDRLLAGGDPDQRRTWARRLGQAITDFDQLRVMTIHEFCSAMLTELGVLASADPEATLVEDLTGLREQVVGDLYLQRFSTAVEPPPFSLAEARQLARDAVAKPDAILGPADAGGAVGERVAFAHAVRAEFADRKERLGVYSFDDQLVRLRDCLVGADAEPARQRLRAACPVVLVDEFQDTDPVQWQILKEAFHGHSAVVLIGDPKQAIYSFRGADVAAYLSAVDVATDRAGLTTNYRADEPVVSALDGFFGSAELGPGIPVPAVQAHHRQSRLDAGSAAAWSPPVRIRCLPAAEPVWVDQARRLIEEDLVAEVRQLLAAGARVAEPDGWRPLDASDIAVLVRTNARGQAIVRALTAAGVPAAFSGSDSVFGSLAARSWLTLLQAIHEPRRSTTRAAILTDFIGGDLVGLATATEQQLADWAGLLSGWRRIHAAEGVAALFVAVQADGAFARRVRGRRLGARDLTDYRHVAEVLHEQERSGMSLGALVDWLVAAIDDPLVAGERSRRLETDADAVQILTIHKAKGLQFPVVLLPEAAELWAPKDKGQSLVFHDDRGVRQLDVGGLNAPGREDRWRISQAEEAADALRTLYVGATRAQSQLTMWWARTARHTAGSPLQRLLFRRRDLPGTPALSYPVTEPPGSGDPTELGWLADAGIAVQPAGIAVGSSSLVSDGSAQPLQAAAWTRRIDRHWRRTSYSGLTAAVHASAPMPMPAGAVDDEAEPATDRIVANGPLSPMTDLPGGTAFGTCVHQVFDSLDWYAGDGGLDGLRQRLIAVCAEALAVTPVAISAEDLAEAMLPSLLTPLGGLTNGRALADLRMTDRLTELEFELPLGSLHRRATLRELAAILADGLPADDPLAGYPELLRDPELADQVLAGFLTGSIDAVLRIPGLSGRRFVVVDYKTNRITAEAELRQAHFGQQAMAAEMLRSHYPLQALLYQVALHRFLTQRLPGYRPERHLGGAGYLFVRGLGGPEPVLDGDLPTGVFAWHPPARTIVAISRLLAGGDDAH